MIFHKFVTSNSPKNNQFCTILPPFCTNFTVSFYPIMIFPRAGARILRAFPLSVLYAKGSGLTQWFHFLFEMSGKWLQKKASLRGGRWICPKDKDGGSILFCSSLHSSYDWYGEFTVLTPSEEGVFGSAIWSDLPVKIKRHNTFPYRIPSAAEYPHTAAGSADIHVHPAHQSGNVHWCQILRQPPSQRSCLRSDLPHSGWPK